MYTEIVKCPKRQDCYYKLTPGSSNETSINLSTEVMRAICPEAKRGETYYMTFSLHKEDFIKALCFLVTKLPLYITNSRETDRIEFSSVFFETELAKINKFFTEDTADYIATLYYREDGRIYLRDLTCRGFNIRKFLVEEKTSMHFIIGSNIQLRLQYCENPSEDSRIISERLAVRDHILKDYIYKVVYLMNKEDGLKSLDPYVNITSESIQIIKEGCFRLTGMFIATTLRDIVARNKYGEKIRWYETPFSLDSNTVYLSTQWYGNGEYQLMFNDFAALINECYGNKFRCNLNENGEFELWETATQLEQAKSSSSSIFIDPSSVPTAFRHYLDHYTDLLPRSKTNYVSVLNRSSAVTICTSVTGESFNSVYAIQDIAKLNEITHTQIFKDFDRLAHGQYSSAIKHYIDFLTKQNDSLLQENK